MLKRCFYRVVLDSFKFHSTNHSVRWNHYKSLGLSPSASLADIKNAYYKLSKIYHPDRNNGSQTSARRFRDIVAAYEVLSKEDSRRKYDREIVRQYDTINLDDFRKKGNKRIKKNQNSQKLKSHFKGDSKSKHTANNRLGKALTKKEMDEFENFIFRAIPFVVACLMHCRKR